LKILHLIPSLGSGGAERQLSLIAPAMAAAGIECHIGYCSEGPNLEPLIASNVHLHRIPLSGNHDPRLFWRVWSLIRNVNPDIVQTWLTQMDVVGGVAALLNRVPWIISERSSASAYPGNWKTFFRSRMGRYASIIVVNSLGGVDYWKSMHIKPPIRLVRNCITPAENAIEVSDVSLTGAPLLLYAGRLSPEKNVELLLDALIRVVSDVPGAVAVLFGEGPLKNDLQQKIELAGLSSEIRLMGYTRNLAMWLDRADVCVSISEFEGHPNVVLEAAAQGCPLTLSNIAAHREIFDESSARFVNQDSLKSVIEGILKVLHQPEEHKSRANCAQKLVALYTIETALNSYQAVYSELLECNEISLIK